MLVKKTLPYALAQLCVVAFQWMSMVFLPLFFSERGFSAAAIGSLISMFSASTLLLVFPLGMLSDRIPPRPLLVIGAVLAIAANLAMPRAQGFQQMAAAVCLSGAGFTVSCIALYSLFFKQVGPGRRGFEVSLFNIGGIMGAGLGAALCGQLSRYYAIGEVIFPLGMSFAGGWALLAFFLPGARGISFPILEYGRDLRRLRTWVLIAVMFVAASHAGFEQAGYALLQTEVIGLTTRAVGMIFLVLSLWMSLITYWTGESHDRQERPLLMMGMALIFSGVFMAASGSARGAGDFLFYRLVHTGGDAVISLLTLVAASMIFPRRRMGGAFAFALTVNTASYFMFANLAGVISGRFGFDRAFHVSGLIEVSGGLALLVFVRRLRTLFMISGAGDEGAG